jgi:hypothetical protein
MDIEAVYSQLDKKLLYLRLINLLYPAQDLRLKEQTDSFVRDISGIFDRVNSNIYFPNIEAEVLRADQLAQTMIDFWNDRFKPKIDVLQIGRDLAELLRQEPKLPAAGIQYKWLDERLDCSPLGLPADLPWHARIGISHHARTFSVEEYWLLEDAFFMLVSARRMMEQIKQLAQIFENSKRTDSETLGKLQFANPSVAAYSRLCVMSFYSFLEAFVNSVGYNYYLHHQNVLNDKAKEKLQGKKKGGFISLEYKISDYPKMICNLADAPINTSDPPQIKEPFKTLIYVIKELRDSSAHFSQNKAAIWKGPVEWLETAELSASTCLACAQEFWLACYPNGPLPMYLKELHSDFYLNRAEERLKYNSSTSFQI